ncbi:hypothetical protein NHH03_21765 [Stieleria sp. TO1_6]|uniref:hypothetical protein n=1 Tax=Stieleria tagensis TaxID=2956795 RepID=UPI00209B51DB|nr:hypothetical protein [Stieleria tagensis]MCO8124382.1 hypothetical protein [Stieleria tagensis]
MPRNRVRISIPNCGSVLLFILMGIHPIADAIADPNTTDYRSGLNAQGTIDGAKNQIERMYATCFEWETLAIDSLAQIDNGGTIAHQKFSRLYAEIYRSIWHAKHLQAMGEPAGLDLERRYILLRNLYGSFAAKLGEFQAKEIGKLRAADEKRKKVIAQALQLAANGKLAAAERGLQTLRLQQLQSVFYLTHSQSKTFENELALPHNQVLQQLNAQRQQQYRQQAAAKIASYQTAITALENGCQQIIAELGRSTGNRPDGPGAIASIETLWGNASAAIDRAVALSWLFDDGPPQAIAAPFQNELQRCQSIAVGAIEQVLESLAQSVDPQQLPTLYPQLLKALTVVDRRVTSDLGPKLEPSLQQLAAKHPDLVAQSQRYSAAVSQPIRWMHRYSEQQIQHANRDYPDASALLNRKFASDTSVRPAVYGPASRSERVLTPGVISQPAGWIAGDAKPLIGMKVKLEHSLRLSPTATISLTRQDRRHYGNLPADVPLAKFIDELDHNLLIDESHEPLSWSAADAKSAAEMQDFRAVGGRIVQLTLESAMTRFATLPDAAHVMIPLDRVPEIEDQGKPLEKAIWRIQAKPDWVAHSLFFAKLE